MKTLADQMSIYAAYHRHPANKAIHFIFVPAIVWSLMVLLAVPHWSVAGIPLSPALLLMLGVLLYYYMLDAPLALLMTAVFGALYVAAIAVVESGTATALWIGGGVFVVSWIFQILGHSVWEKRKPALADNFLQVFVAPIFLATEALFAVGGKQQLHKEVEEKMQAHLPSG